MYLVLLAVFLTIGAGAWNAWHRNPKYSTQTTLRLLAAIVAILGTLVGVNLLIFNKLVDRSPNLAFTLMIFSVLVGVVILSVIVMRMTDSTSAAPAGVAIRNIHRRKVGRWAAYTVVVVLLALAPAKFLPENWAEAQVILAGMLLFVSIFALAPAYYQARLRDRGLAALQANPWAHWRYTPAQWAEWTETQVVRSQKSSKILWKQNRIILGVIAVVIVVVMWLKSDSLKTALIAMAAGFVMLGILVFLVRWSALHAPQALRRRYAQSPPEAYIGPGGLFAGGEYNPWVLSGRYLIGVLLDERQPRSLLFVFNQSTTNGAVRVEKPVLIPVDAEADIVRLQGQLSEACPGAVVQIVDQRVTDSELKAAASGNGLSSTRRFSA